MEMFTRAKLTKNQPGTVASTTGLYGGVADRDIILTLADGTELPIWDNGVTAISPVSTDLRVGLTYNLLLCDFPEEKAHYATQPFAQTAGMPHGQIIDADWRIPQTDLFSAIHESQNIAALLLSTALGKIMYYQSVIDIPVQVGAFLRWDSRGESLMAVYLPEQPAPHTTLPTNVPTAPWQRETLIALARQQELLGQLQIVPAVTLGRYPFAGMVLSRADIEWLLLTHQSASLVGTFAGPVDWDDETQRDRPGLDLRGADLRGIDLSGLPLTGLIGGLAGDAWKAASEQERTMAAVRLERANLTGARLEAALLRDAHLEAANLTNAHLDSALLRGAHLDRARLASARLWHTMLSGASLREAVLQGADLVETDLLLADCSNAFMQRASLRSVQAQGTNFDDANLSEAHIEQTFFYHARLERANLTNAQVIESDLRLGGRA